MNKLFNKLIRRLAKNIIAKEVNLEAKRGLAKRNDMLDNIRKLEKQTIANIDRELSRHYNIYHKNLEKHELALRENKPRDVRRQHENLWKQHRSAAHALIFALNEIHGMTRYSFTPSHLETVVEDLKNKPVRADKMDTKETKPVSSVKIPAGATKIMLDSAAPIKSKTKTVAKKQK